MIIIHINTLNMRSNKKRDKDYLPVVIIKDHKEKRIANAMECEFEGKFRIKYSPNAPLSACGEHLRIEEIEGMVKPIHWDEKKAKRTLKFLGG